MTKKLFYLFAFAAMAFAGCGDPGNDNPDDPDNPDVPVGESVVIAGVKWATRNVGTTPGKFVSKPEDYGGYYTFDAAQTACPTGWRTPTSEEIQSVVLAGNEWTTRGGVNGRLLGIANDGKTIFLPAAGSLSGDDGQFAGVGRGGSYWSATVYGSNGSYYLFFNGSYVDPSDSRSRGYGFSVRCVAE